MIISASSTSLKFTPSTRGIYRMMDNKFSTIRNILVFPFYSYKGTFYPHLFNANIYHRLAFALMYLARKEPGDAFQ